MPKSAAKKVGSKVVKPAKMTSSSRADIIFPPARFMRMMRRDRLNERISKQAAIYMAGCIEYLAQEIVEMSGDIAIE